MNENEKKAETKREEEEFNAYAMAVVISATAELLHALESLDELITWFPEDKEE